MIDIPGKHTKGVRLVRTERFVVAVEVDMVIPDDDPTEPCLDPSAVKLLREVQDHAERGDVAWLAEHGKVYEAIQEAA